MNRRWKVAGINFDHFHMGDLLHQAAAHPSVDIVGVCDDDPAKMGDSIRQLSIPADRVFTDVASCLDQTGPDVVILCPATADHAIWTEQVADFGVHVLIEKPFAATLADADRMIAAMQRAQRQLAVNWPLRWYPCHATTYRLIQEGRLGNVQEVHYYDGNRGPLWHGADKVAREPTAAEKASSWFYRRAAGGGSLLDYLGYGATLATWYFDGQVPSEICCMVDRPEGLEVDEHSITLARYPFGLSKFETRWGTFTDPWTHQPQPKCGFVVCGTEGTLSSFDFEATVRLQTRQHPEGVELPVDQLRSPNSNPVEYFLDCLSRGEPVSGPLSPAISRIGQQIVDTALQSSIAGHALPLVN